MKKGLLIALVAIIILGTGTVFYLQFNKTNSNNDTTGETGNKDGTTTPGDGTTTPGDGTTTPGDGTTTPGDGTTTPGDGTTTPGDGTTTPGDGTTTPGTVITNTVKTGASCKSGDYVKLDTILTYCITTAGLLNLKTTVDQVGADTLVVTAAPSLLTVAGANISFTEKISNIAYFATGNDETIGLLGLSIMTTPSGKVYLIDNTLLYEKAQLVVHATIDVGEKIISFTSPDKTVSGLNTTVKTSSGKVYIVYAHGDYKAK